MNRLSFHHSVVVFATNHQKAQAAREPFARILSTTVEEVTIESDRLGTFSGEVERPGSMLDALRGKVRLAREATDARFVLVSEGSFGSSGSLGFAAHGVEMLMLHDSLTGAEVLEQHTSWETNYATATLSTSDELEGFLRAISFGTHALVLYPHGLLPSAKLSTKIYKGIVTHTEAEQAFRECLQASPVRKVLAMSDMRAHLNPTRMRAISSCCELLAHRLANQCPRCHSGGFGLVATIPGLPCEWCGSPTQRARAEKHACVVCSASIEKPRTDGKIYADPEGCDFCNP